MAETRARVAVLDDYQGVAASFADWPGQLPAVEVTYFREYLDGVETVAAALQSFDVVVAMRERTPFPRALLEQLPNLKLLVTTGARNAAIDVEAASAHGITVSTTGSHPGGTAELTWALILAMVRDVAAHDRTIRAGGWQDAVSLDLYGKTLGVVGLGRLGTRVAAVGAAFGMDVIAWSPNLNAERAAAGGATLATKAELFAKADVVTVHMVLSDRTRGLIGEPELKAMRSTAFLVNASRAPLIDQDALQRAITNNWLAGVALDVYETEPLPTDHWLRQSPGTLLSPHMGYVTEGSYRKYFGDVVEDIAAFLAGTPIRLLES